MAAQGGVEQGNRGQGLETLAPLRFPHPERFDGTESNFEEFAIHLRSYLTTSNPLYFERMREIELQPNHDPIDFATLTDQEKLLSAQLQQALQALCKGSALKLVSQDQLGVNGFETWRRMYQRYRPIQKARAASRMNTIMK